MLSFFLHIYDFLHQRRRLCFGLLALLTGLLLVMMSTLKYNENIYDFLPVSGNEQKAITLYQDITGGQRIVAMFKIKDAEHQTSDLSHQPSPLSPQPSTPLHKGCRQEKVAGTSKR